MLQSLSRMDVCINYYNNFYAIHALNTKLQHCECIHYIVNYYCSIVSNCKLNG